MTEFHDEMPVTGYEVRFAGRQEIPTGFGEKLYKGHVAVFVVAALVDNAKAEYVLRKDFEDEKIRRYVLNLEDAQPLTGALRDQVILFLSNGGQEGALDFGTPTEAELAMDRLQQYLKKSWPAQYPETTKHEDLVRAAIEQLENYLAGVSPHPTAVEETPDPNPPEDLILEDLVEFLEDEIVPGEPIPPAPKSVPDLMEALQDSVEAARAVRKEAEEVLDEEPAPKPAMDVDALKAMMAADDSPKDRGGLKVGKPEIPNGELDADGFPITIMDEVEVVGSVYPPGHTGRDRQLIEGLA